MPALDPSLIPIPEVTAADVVDRETLKAFVHGAKESFIAAVEQIGLEQFIQQRHIFREEGSPWKKGSVYFFVFSTDGHVLFHGADPSLELCRWACLMDFLQSQANLIPYHSYLT